MGQFLSKGSEQSDETDDIEWDKIPSIHLFVIFCLFSVFRLHIVTAIQLMMSDFIFLWTLSVYIMFYHCLNIFFSL